MLYEIIRYLNILPYGADPTGLIQRVEEGEFVIADGQISLSTELYNGQHFVIEGSNMNDGAYTAPVDLTDERFEGKVYVLSKNQAFEALLEKAFAQKQAFDNPSKFQTESFGGYSYTIATDANGRPLTWKTAMAADFRPWRKV